MSKSNESPAPLPGKVPALGKCKRCDGPVLSTQDYEFADGCYRHVGYACPDSFQDREAEAVEILADALCRDPGSDDMDLIVLCRRAHDCIARLKAEVEASGSDLGTCAGDSALHKRIMGDDVFKVGACVGWKPASAPDTLTRNEWIKEAATTIKTVIDNVDQTDRDVGLPVLQPPMRRALGELLDRLALVEGDLSDDY